MAASGQGRGQCILVIDDDDAVAGFVRNALASLGYAVRVAADGAQGVRLFLAERPDGVLCDLFMPDKDGLEVIPELRRHDATVPVVAMSGGSAVYTQDLLPVARRLGAAAALRKPFSVRDLAACLESVLAPARPAAEGPRQTGPRPA
jgi:DNA-binding response OmpR family regulator